MTIVITAEELTEETNPYFKSGLVKDLSIDYATNCIHGYVGSQEHVVFRFKDHGIYLDNRYISYQISGGSAGILVQIYSTA
jgi:hypothetical protein